MFWNKLLFNNKELKLISDKKLYFAPKPLSRESLTSRWLKLLLSFKNLKIFKKNFFVKKKIFSCSSFKGLFIYVLNFFHMKKRSVAALSWRLKKKTFFYQRCIFVLFFSRHRDASAIQCANESTCIWKH